MRAQMAQDFRKVTTLVFLPPLMALGYIAACSVFGFIGVQLWLENVEMAPGDVTPYGWEQEMEDWSGGPKGGTDPSLGMIPRIGLRSAWLFQNWAGLISQSSSSESSYIPRLLLSGPDRGYQLAERQLTWVMRYLKERNKPVPTVLIIRHAELLERLGTPRALQDARLVYTRLYQAAPPNSFEAAQLALKIGNLAARNDADDAALDYYTRATTFNMDLAQYSPIQQRHLTNTLIQLSDFYSRQEDLERAYHFQGNSLRQVMAFLSNLPSDEDTLERRTHWFYISHRAQVLLLHLSEVAYAQSYGAKPFIPIDEAVPLSVQGLKDAGNASLDTFQTFREGGIPSASLDANRQQINRIPFDNTLSKPYAKSRSLRQPAASLLRDSRRSAIHAWSLVGLIMENVNAETAMNAHQAALRWAGMTVADGKKLGVPENEVITVQNRIDSLQSRINAKQ